MIWSVGSTVLGAAIIAYGLTDIFLTLLHPHARERMTRGIVSAVEDLNEKQPPSALFTTPDGQKFCPLAKPRWRGLQGLAGCRQSVRLCSGGEPLAATVAAGGNDTATTLGSHAGTKAMPTLADEFGRLIGTLHLF